MADQHRELMGLGPGTPPTEDRSARLDRLDRYLADRDKSAVPATEEPLARGPRTVEHALSFGQEQIWLHSQLSSDPSIYNEPLTLTHRGDLDIGALRRTLGEIIRRHEAWRTTFREVDGRPIALVHDAPDVELPVIDLRDLAPGDREVEAIRLATDDARRPFDLEVGPLLRFLLIKMSDNEQRLYLTLHQIIFDGVSMYSGFLPEVAAIYDDFSSGRGVALSEPPAQYQDFVRWQRATATGRTLEAQLAYWLEQLAEARSPLDLPTDRPRPTVQSYHGEQISFVLPADLSRELRSFSRREGVTLFTTLLTAFASLLVRRTGDEIPTIGSVTSMRKRTELEGLLGFYLNTLALRIDLSGDPSFREALRRTRKVAVDGLSHDDIPIHQIVQSLALPRDQSRSPLFQTMLVLEPPLPDPPAGWELSQLDIDVGRSRVDLYLEFDDRPGAIIGRIRYSTALFQRSTVDRILAQLEVLLQSAIASPDRPIGALPVLDDAERVAWRSAGNRVAPTTPFEPFISEEVEQSIPSRFARQVKRFGNRPAIVTEDRTWSYRELDAAAEAIARSLASIAGLADGTRTRIGVVGEPGLPLIAAIFGILKAGGAYVPLDPDIPARRMRAIVQDAGLDVVIATGKVAGLSRAAVGDTAAIVDLSEVLGELAPDQSDARIDRAAAALPAYLLYTSGSTGEPKGILQSQRGVLHHIRVYTNALHLGPDDRVLLVAKPTFDASVMDVFGALLNGAALCIVDLTAVGFLGLREAIVDRRVTVYHSTPTVYRELVASLRAEERLDGLRAVVLGGEEVRASDLDAFRSHFANGSVFVNGLGPTESTLALQYFADQSSVLDRLSVPIGYPVEATEAFLLDPYRRETEFVGEIAIRSRYVALGYWNRPELTAAVFERDPDDPELVTYRTGDLGRRLADGSIEFAGRRDRQVKVRGIRTEVTEIELALAALPSVRQVAVEVRPVAGESKLVAYLEASGADRPSQHDVRAALRDQLPEYMVPSVVVWLDRMPITSSNKVDRAALPTPQASPDMKATGPRDSLERRLVAIWEDLLTRHPVGIDEDFFEIGGHSLLAARLFDRIWRETGMRVPMSALLEGATIEHLARRIRAGANPARSGLIEVQPRGTQLPVFVVPGAGSRVLYLRNLAAHLGTDQPLYALHQPPTGPIGQGDRRIEALADHYVSAIRKVQPTGPYHLVGYSFGGAVAFETAQQLTARGETVALLALIDSRNPVQPLPLMGFHPRFVVRRIVNQARIVRLLGPRVGARYLKARTRIAMDNSVTTLRNLLNRRLPGQLRQSLWRDQLPEGEREWLAADGAAFDRYRPAPYPGRITFLWAEHNQRPPVVFDTRRGWAELARGGFDVRPIPGSHLTVLIEPLAAITGAVLAEVLSQARNGGAGEDLHEGPAPLGDVADLNSTR